MNETGRTRLRAAIAQEVMGLQVVATDWPCYNVDGFWNASLNPNRGGNGFRLMPVYVDDINDKESWPPHPDEYNPGALEAFVVPVPHYESDIAAAWQVVKHLEAQGYSWQVNQESGQDCYFEFSKRLEPNEFGLVKWQSGRARETDVALAVCLAAYMAVKGEGWK
jgi:hypothetical protein